LRQPFIGRLPRIGSVMQPVAKGPFGLTYVMKTEFKLESIVQGNSRTADKYVFWIT